MTQATTSTAGPLAEEARAVLRHLVARDDADFRDGQLDAVDALVDGHRRVLVVQRTGWGKSAVYFVATALLRARGAGPTVIVSPLLALMRDQVAAAARAGVRAAMINSANADEWGEVSARLAADDVDVLLLSPERLNNPRFREEQLPGLVARCGMLVVDEAHCISDWGHDFRPDYRRIRELLARLPEGTPVLATTATANARVVADVDEQLRATAGGDAPADVLTLRGPLARDSLRLGVLTLRDPTERVAWLAAHLGGFTGSGIVYALTVSAAEDTAEALRAAGHEVAAYTGRTPTEERQDLEDALLHNRVKALVATSALGMGFDKPDLGFVVHLGAPSSPVAYYQQVGRAGRATEHADALLLPGTEDREIWRYFATVSMPREEDAAAVLRALAESGQPLSTAALETVADVRRTRLELLLKVLDVDGAVRRVRGGWEATGAPWRFDAERYARVAEARAREQRSMVDYQAPAGAAGAVCRMRFLQEALDDPTAADCGRCDVCAGPWYDAAVPDAASAQVAERLDKAGVPVPPRRQWPSGMARLGVPVSGRIAAELGCAEGRAVARLTDLGWGGRLRERLAAPDAPIEAGDPLVRAVVAVLRDWDWAERPVAVASVPSVRHPRLVGSLAAGVASLGRLDDLGPLDLAGDAAPGEPGGNSAFRLAAVWERFAVPEAMAARLAGPVLLVDDLADSRWTLTVCGSLLRRAGAPAVLPLVLALAG